MNPDWQARIGAAVAQFWRLRHEQQIRQGSTAGRRDRGFRGAVTGGRHLDGFIELVRTLLTEAGLPEAAVEREHVTLPGYFRPTKEWDLVVVADGHLIASLEFKSHVGPSFGNNFNNRTEEAVGSATDLWTAYREGALQGSIRPWLGYFLLLEHARSSASPVSVREPHFPVCPDFRESSYAKRYEILCRRLVRERRYDAACFLMSPREAGKAGQFTEPCDEVSFHRFATSLTAHAASYARFRDK